MKDFFIGRVVVHDNSTDLSVESSRQLSRILFSDTGTIQWPHSENVLSQIRWHRPDANVTIRLILETGTYALRISAGDRPDIVYCRVSEITATQRERTQVASKVRGVRYCDGKPVAVSLRRDFTAQKWKSEGRKLALQI